MTEIEEILDSPQLVHRSASNAEVGALAEVGRIEAWEKMKVSSPQRPSSAPLDVKDVFSHIPDIPSQLLREHFHQDLDLENVPAKTLVPHAVVHRESMANDEFAPMPWKQVYDTFAAVRAQADSLSAELQELKSSFTFRVDIVAQAINHEQEVRETWTQQQQKQAQSLRDLFILEKQQMDTELACLRGEAETIKSSLRSEELRQEHCLFESSSEIGRLQEKYTELAQKMTDETKNREVMLARIVEAITETSKATNEQLQQTQAVIKQSQTDSSARLDELSARYDKQIQYLTGIWERQGADILGLGKLLDQLATTIEDERVARKRDSANLRTASEKLGSLSFEIEKVDRRAQEWQENERKLHETQASPLVLSSLSGSIHTTTQGLKSLEKDFVALRDECKRALQLGAQRRTSSFTSESGTSSSSKVQVDRPSSNVTASADRTPQIKVGTPRVKVVHGLTGQQQLGVSPLVAQQKHQQRMIVAGQQQSAVQARYNSPPAGCGPPSPQSSVGRPQAYQSARTVRSISVGSVARSVSAPAMSRSARTPSVGADQRVTVHTTLNTPR